MARTGRPTAKLELSDDERETLQRWARRPKSAQALALRAKIVLACAEGATNKAVATEFSVTPQMVGKWRARFVADRLAGLSDEDRPGRPRTITDAHVEQVVIATLEQAPPDEGTHWSTRMMAARTGLTQTAVSRIWRAFELKPHKVDYWKLSTDPHFVDKLYDVVGLYLDPPERAVVLCVDEKSQVQALDRSAPVLPMMPANPQRQTHTYIRPVDQRGTTSLFAALDVANGHVHASLQRRHRATEFREFLAQLDRDVPQSTTCTSSWTTTPPTRPPRSAAGWPATPASTCTSPRPAAPGSTSSNASSPNSPPECCDAASTATSPNSKPTSAPGSSTGTTTPSPTSGPRPPNRSSTRSAPTANDFLS